MSYLLVRRTDVVLTSQLTAIEDCDRGSTERRKPHENQSGERSMDCHLAAEVFNYNKATILNNCICLRVTHMKLENRQENNVRKPIYSTGNSIHMAASKAV